MTDTRGPGDPALLLTAAICSPKKITSNRCFGGAHRQSETGVIAVRTTNRRQTPRHLTKDNFNLGNARLV